MNDAIWDYDDAVAAADDDNVDDDRYVHIYRNLSGDSL